MLICDFLDHPIRKGWPNDRNVFLGIREDAVWASNPGIRSVVWETMAPCICGFKWEIIPWSTTYYSWEAVAEGKLKEFLGLC